MKQFFISLLLIINGLCSFAQLYTAHNLYPENMFIYNPAYAGSAGRFVGFVDYKHHLTAITDAPKTGLFGIQMPVGGAMGVGAVLKTERIGLIETNVLRFDYAYRTRLMKNQSIAFGLNGGIMTRNLNVDKLIVLDDTDPTLAPDYFKKSVFFFGGGIDYRAKNLDISASLPVIYRSGNNLYFSSQLYSAYGIVLGNDWYVKPAFTAIFSQAKPEGWHAHFSFGYGQFFWMRATYKASRSVVGAVGLAFGKMGIAYAYETNNKALAYIGGATHEISLSYGMFDTQKISPEPIDTIIVPVENEYVHRMRRMIEDNTYDLFVKAGNFAGYNQIFTLTDSMYRSKPPVKEEPIKDTEIVVVKNKPDTTVVHKTEPPIISEKTGVEILDKGLKFSENSAMLDAQGRAYLDKVAEFLISKPDFKIHIYGHSCDIGSDAVNKKISTERAETVRYYLTSKGVPESQITTQGISDIQPIVPNTNEKNRKKNRRVTFVIVK